MFTKGQLQKIQEILSDAHVPTYATVECDSEHTHYDDDGNECCGQELNYPCFGCGYRYGEHQDTCPVTEILDKVQEELDAMEGQQSEQEEEAPWQVIVPPKTLQS